MQDQPVTQWTQHIPKILFELRTRANDATGLTPGRALLEYDLPRPGEWNLVQEQPEINPEGREERLRHIRERQQRYVHRYDRPTEPPLYEQGQEVVIRYHPPANVSHAFAAKWIGPYVVRDIYSGRVYNVERDRKVVRVHQDDIRPAPQQQEHQYAAQPPPPTPPPQPVAIN